MILLKQFVAGVGEDDRSWRASDGVDRSRAEVGEPIVCFAEPPFKVVTYSGIYREIARDMKVILDKSRNRCAPRAERSRSSGKRVRVWKAQKEICIPLASKESREAERP